MLYPAQPFELDVVGLRTERQPEAARLEEAIPMPRVCNPADLNDYCYLIAVPAQIKPQRAQNARANCDSEHWRRIALCWLKQKTMIIACRHLQKPAWYSSTATYLHTMPAVRIPSASAVIISRALLPR